MLNTIYHGDCEDILHTMLGESVDLVFSSPPYFNTKRYSAYANYDAYLNTLYRIFVQCHRVLKKGRFIAINSSPILVSRKNRQSQSSRLPIPFDLHSQLIKIGFDFIDDIIWQKPEGSGWVSGRGRRFSADRNPLQYKTVPVTEYVMIYRKHTDKLIDWNISQIDPKIVKASKITGTYDVTNVWQIPTAHDKLHPAVFPIELAEKIIRYYSFKGDMVLDPFAGIGTTGKAAIKLERHFCLIEKEQEYVDAIANYFSDDITIPVQYIVE